MEPYFELHHEIGIGPDARSAAHFQVDERDKTWRVRQALDDPERFHEWAIVTEVDLDASDAAGVAIVTPIAVERL